MSRRAGPPDLLGVFRVLTSGGRPTFGQIRVRCPNPAERGSTGRERLTGRARGDVPLYFRWAIVQRPTPPRCANSIARSWSFRVPDSSFVTRPSRGGQARRSRVLNAKKQAGPRLS